MTAATTTYDSLKRILQEKFRVPEGEIDLARTLRDHDLDSLDIVELSVVVEQELGATVSDDELSDAGTLSNVVELITSRAVAA